MEVQQPIRIQRRRTKGWKMPPNTASVCRPGTWGNPFVVNPDAEPGSKFGAQYVCVPSAEEAVACFSALLKFNGLTRRARTELRGKNLACFCELGQPCHADVLLEVANGPMGSA